MISAVIAVAISAGVKAPMSSPAGPWIRGDRVGLDPAFGQPLRPSGLGVGRAEAADIAGPTGQRGLQGRAVDVAIVAEHDDRIGVGQPADRGRRGVGGVRRCSSVHSSSRAAAARASAISAAADDDQGRDRPQRGDHSWPHRRASSSAVWFAPRLNIRRTPGPKRASASSIVVGGEHRARADRWSRRQPRRRTHGDQAGRARRSRDRPSRIRRCRSPAVRAREPSRRTTSPTPVASSSLIPRSSTARSCGAASSRAAQLGIDRAGEHGSHRRLTGGEGGDRAAVAGTESRGSRRPGRC